MAAPACELSAGRNWFGIDPRLPADRCPPYFQAEVSVPKSPGKEPVQLDIALNRGVRVTGRILDKDTGMPVSGRVAYFAFDDNPHRNRDPDPGRRSNIHWTNVDGVFRLVIPPGPGVLAAYVFGPYVRGPGSRPSTTDARTGSRMSAVGSGSPMNSTRSSGSNRRRMPLPSPRISWSSPVADDLEPGRPRATYVGRPIVRRKHLVFLVFFGCLFSRVPGRLDGPIFALPIAGFLVYAEQDRIPTCCEPSPACPLPRVDLRSCPGSSFGAANFTMRKSGPRGSPSCS